MHTASSLVGTLFGKAVSGLTLVMNAIDHHRKKVAGQRAVTRFVTGEGDV
ncbi:MAG: hypothetical protein ACXV3U_05670 [Halobacteriota archaeon]